MTVVGKIAIGTAPVAAPAASARAAEESDEKVKKDLFAVITLRGEPCGAAIRVERRSENDYVAICKAGDRYRVYVAPDDRVVVEKQR